jgi:hypothetical protein
MPLVRVRERSSSRQLLAVIYSPLHLLFALVHRPTLSFLFYASGCGRGPLLIWFLCILQMQRLISRSLSTAARGLKPSVPRMVAARPLCTSLLSSMPRTSIKASQQPIRYVRDAMLASFHRLSYD